MSTDDTRPDLPGGHAKAQDRRGPSSPGTGDLPAPARRAAEAAHRNWRIGDDGEGRLHAALVAAAPLIRAEAEAKLAAQREYDTYRRALWAMVRQFGGSVFLTSVQMEDVPLLASLGIGREPGGIRINAGEEP